MGGFSKIPWCDCTYNIVTGCTKISPGCANCYALPMSRRLGGNHLIDPNVRQAYAQAAPWKAKDWSGVITPIPGAIERMHKELSRSRKPRRVFVQSMGDLFHDNVPHQLIFSVLSIAATLEKHPFMFLTKRLENMRHLLALRAETLHMVPPNIWAGGTVCNQAEADEKIPILLETPAAVRFISVEPMLGPVNASFFLDSLPAVMDGRPRLDWVVCGSETGPGARYMDPAWARDLRDQCRDAGVPFFMKKVSLGTSMPADLLVREMPDVNP